MGYYASGNGSITFKDKLTREERDAVFQLLSDAFACDWCDLKDGNNVSTSFSIWNSEKYYDDEVRHALDSAAETAEIKDGEIEYVGEDGSLWRFIYRPHDLTTVGRGRWEEQSGRVVYD